ncbi:hypothetical protein [Acholeplasma granularum]|uniref:hypothetical protein n=1 Tax=Acholeplasma granularum TaxID=264635 RepID=UPI0004724347|nr:hypothetical protein [Acholeplasma granularum]
MKLTNKYASKFYFIFFVIFLFFALFIFFLYSGKYEDKIILLSIFSLISFLLLIIAIINLSMFIKITDKIIVNKIFKTTILDFEDIKIIELKTEYPHRGGIYTAIGLKFNKVLIETKSKKYVYKYVGNQNSKFWMEVKKNVRVTGIIKETY